MQSSRSEQLGIDPTDSGTTQVESLDTGENLHIADHWRSRHHQQVFEHPAPLLAKVAKRYSPTTQGCTTTEPSANSVANWFAGSLPRQNSIQTDVSIEITPFASEIAVAEEPPPGESCRRDPPAAGAPLAE